MSERAEWRGRRTIVAAGAALPAAVAIAVGLPLWLVVAVALVGVTLAVIVLVRGRRRLPAPLTRVRTDDLVARDAVLHRLQPLTPRAAPRQRTAGPRPMLWERPNARARRA